MRTDNLRYPILALAAALALLPARTGRAQEAEPAPPEEPLPAEMPAVPEATAGIAPGPGEIRLDGKIRSVTLAQKQFVLDVRAFTLPDGRTKSLAKPKPKTVRLTGETSIHDADDSRRAMSLKQLKPGALVAVIGKDLGSGKELTAREVAAETGRKTAAAPPTPRPTGPKPAAPQGNGINRAQTAQAIYDFLIGVYPDEKDAEVGPLPFPDVPANHANARAVNLLTHRGVFTGEADGTFGPMTETSRYDLAVYLQRLEAELRRRAGTNTEPVPGAAIPDVPMDHYALDAAMRMVGLGVMQLKDGMFQGDTGVTAAEIREALQKLRKAASTQPSQQE